MTRGTAASPVRRENPAPDIARIVLARPELRNAQSPELLYALERAFADATTDDTRQGIILAADGPDFSSGHDLRAGFSLPCAPVALQAGLGASGIQGHYAFECEAYLGLCKRWREISKPTIAQAQGRTIAAGLMLLWHMGIIIAAEDASFADPVTAFDINGVEYFAHAWELGARRRHGGLNVDELRLPTDGPGWLSGAEVCSARRSVKFRVKLSSSGNHKEATAPASCRSGPFRCPETSQL